jgi:hypothetical protein
MEGSVFRLTHHVADRDAAPCWIDYQRIARKTPSWENTSFVTHFSADEGITSCCSIIRGIHHTARMSGIAEGYTA